MKITFNKTREAIWLAALTGSLMAFASSAFALDTTSRCGDDDEITRCGGDEKDARCGEDDGVARCGGGDTGDDARCGGED